MNVSLDFDWNLLKCLEALLAERNVTRAARRVGLSQPAMSRALGRLRTVFGDELFVRAGKGMEPTPRAEKLVSLLRDMRESLTIAVAESVFQPRTSEREFVVAGADLAELTLVPKLVRVLAREAPLVSLRYVSAARGPEEMLLDRSVDLVLNPRLASEGSRIVGQKLFDEEFSCIVRADHPEVGRRLGLAKFCALEHLLIAPRGTRGGIVDGKLAELGLRRRVALLVPSFLSAPEIVAQSDLIATLPTRIARLAASRLPLRVLPPPLEVPGFSMMQYWSAVHTDDPAHRFLRGAMERAARLAR